MPASTSNCAPEPVAKSHDLVDHCVDIAGGAVHVPEPARDSKAADDCESETRNVVPRSAARTICRDRVTDQHDARRRHQTRLKGAGGFQIAEDLDASCTVQGEIERNEERMHDGPVKP